MKRRSASWRSTWRRRRERKSERAEVRRRMRRMMMLGEALCGSRQNGSAGRNARHRSRSLLMTKARRLCRKKRTKRRRHKIGWTPTRARRRMMTVLLAKKRSAKRKMARGKSVLERAPSRTKTMGSLRRTWRTTMPRLSCCLGRIASKGGGTQKGSAYGSSVLRRRNKPAASRIRLNSMQNACTSTKRSCTLMLLLRMRLCRNTHTRRTRRFCMYLSRMFSQL
mmetsp:Transcript_16943/g.36810  ORF Transcript_16943/g.36810 Transcript_16943/m.36810 type:complete len:223 (-) Transcript_16943:117-785(-)